MRWQCRTLKVAKPENGGVGRWLEEHTDMSKSARRSFE